MHRYATATWILGLVCFVANSKQAARLCKNSASSALKHGGVLSTMNTPALVGFGIVQFMFNGAVPMTFDVFDIVIHGEYDMTTFAEVNSEAQVLVDIVL